MFLLDFGLVVRKSPHFNARTDTMTIVDELHQNFTDILATIPESEVSLRNVASEIFRKGLLLSAASLFEKQLTELISRMTAVWGRDNLLLLEFIRINAIERKYHTYFDWDSGKANRFFGLFGDDFKTKMVQRCKSDQKFDEAVKAFVQLGSDRNRLVHQDFGAFSLEKTAEEIYLQYQTAIHFINELSQCFTDYRDPATQIREHIKD